MATATKPHIKHAQLARPTTGDFGRNELAMLGTPCSNINKLVQVIAAALPQYAIGFADESHHEDEAHAGPSISYTKQPLGANVIYKASFNSMQQRALFSNADIVLVNGNHFTASKQIVVVDDAKPLHKKLDKLTNVCLVLLQDGVDGIPAYLSQQVPGILDVPVLSIQNEEAIIAFIANFIQQSIPVINGLVLAGGESRRMGSDKGSLAYHNNITQRQHVYNLLQPHCSEVYVSCNATQKVLVTTEGLPFIEDSFTGLGPLSGILSAFRHNPNVAWLTVACDLPYLSNNALQQLIEGRDATKMATAFRNNDDKAWPEPLITIWEPRSYQWLLQLLAQGYSCPRKALINADIALLDIANPGQLHNVNEYSDYLTIQQNLQAI